MQIFDPFWGCLFTFFRVSFEIKKVLIWMKSNVSILLLLLFVLLLTYKEDFTNHLESACYVTGSMEVCVGHQ